MKVKEFIEFLSKLDPEKSIWVSYDGGYYICSPLDVFIVYDSSKNFFYGAKSEEKNVLDGDFIFDVQ